eukprot:COSAG03_NODE_11716_length_579_cov_1.072917_1_plen_170_part_10
MKAGAGAVGPVLRWAGTGYFRRAVRYTRRCALPGNPSTRGVQAHRCQHVDHPDAAAAVALVTVATSAMACATVAVAVAGSTSCTSDAAQPQHSRIEYRDAGTGRPYFYNERTGATVWDRPPKVTAVAPCPDEWHAHVDPCSGKTYYHNAATGVTQWNRPPAEAEAENAAV